MSATTPSPQERMRADLDPSQSRAHPFDRPRSTTADIIFNVLDPVPYGFLVAALIFDAVYANSAEVLWCKAAAWLIAIGLTFAIIPRLINLAQVWFPGPNPRAPGAMAGFWLYLLGIAAAIVNAFVHSRDAYGVMPEGLWLSSFTVVLLVAARVISTLRWSNKGLS